MTNASDLFPLSAAELLAADIAPRRDLLAPLLAAGTTALVYGPAGIGKSFFALSLAWAVAGGGSFLGWRSPRPHRVFYVDGEMGAVALRERVALFGPTPAGLTLCTHDRIRGPLLDITEESGLLRLMAAWNDPDLVVFDTLSSLAGLRSGRPERWVGVQRLLLHQKTFGRAVLLVHHANRLGRPRGSSQRENGVDLVIGLRPPGAGAPPRHRPRGARFEIHVEKTHGLDAAPPRPILAALHSEEGHAHWHWGPCDGGRLERAVALFERGLGAEEVAAELGVSRATVFRLKAAARANGLWNGKGGLP